LPVAQFPHTKLFVAPVVAENVPAAQSPHTELFVAPLVAENLPAAPFTQNDCPVSGLYLPSQQESQTLAPATENLPI
jgi:hypothetical protein